MQCLSSSFNLYRQKCYCILTGNPLDILLGEDATQEEYAIMTEYLGLDKPLWVQYGIFISNVFRGDLGESIYFRMPVTELIVNRAPATINLALAAAVASLVISLPVGVFAAVKRDK